jgi:murein DD-endopeptidase MepM/ murein hydrolase activator NlpD
MAVGAHFDTADCGVWGFQAGCRHWGTDFTGSAGDPVFTPYDLTIIALGEYGPGATAGQYVQGTLPDGSVYYSGHLAGRPALAIGQTVPAGTQIGVMNSFAHTHVQFAAAGNTGPCAQDGSCLDFEAYWSTH